MFALSMAPQPWVSFLLERDAPKCITKEEKEREVEEEQEEEETMQAQISGLTSLFPSLSVFLARAFFAPRNDKQF